MKCFNMINEKSAKIVATGSFIFFVLLLFLNRPSYSEERIKFKQGLSIKIKSGANYLAYGSINDHLKSYDTYLSEMTGYEGGKTKALHFSSDLETELVWDISTKFSLSLGIGYISGKNKSYYEYTGPFPFQTWNQAKQNYFIKPRFKTIPLKLGIYYNLPIFSRIRLFLNSGLGYYFSKASLYKCHWSCAWGGYDIIYTKEEIYDVSSNGLGLHGGIGFEYSIANNLALVLEIQGRYARIKNLKGHRYYSLTMPFEMSSGEEEGGTLYVGERDLTNEGYGENCPDLIISPSLPTGNGFKNIKEVVLDLSGYSLRAGIRIRLF
jgi:hypothetical protein